MLYFNFILNTLIKFLNKKASKYNVKKKKKLNLLPKILLIFYKTRYGILYFFKEINFKLRKI